jgi:hypothetical protein
MRDLRFLVVGAVPAAMATFVTDPASSLSVSAPGTNQTTVEPTSATGTVSMIVWIVGGESHHHVWKREIP